MCVALLSVNWISVPGRRVTTQVGVARRIGMVLTISVKRFRAVFIFISCRRIICPSAEDVNFEIVSYDLMIAGMLMSISFPAIPDEWKDVLEGTFG